MPYLGQKPKDTFTASASQTITGTGATSYSLNQTVTSPEDIEVFINNVQQQPTVAYTVSGQTITFDEALLSTDSCYVVFRGARTESRTHPAASNLQAANITASGNSTTSGNSTISGTLDVTGVTNLDSNVSVGGESTIHAGQVGPTNRYLQVHGPSGNAGVVSLGRDTNGDNQSLGELRFYNSNNADDANNDADGKLVGVVQARAETSDSNAGDDSGAHVMISTKPEGGNLDERLRVSSVGNVGIGASALGAAHLLTVRKSSNGNEADVQIGNQVIRRGFVGINSSETRWYKAIQYSLGNIFTGDIKIFVNRGGGFNQTQGFKIYNCSIAGYNGSLYGFATDSADAGTSSNGTIHLGSDAAIYIKSSASIYGGDIFFTFEGSGIMDWVFNSSTYVTSQP